MQHLENLHTHTHTHIITSGFGTICHSLIKVLSSHLSFPTSLLMLHSVLHGEEEQNKAHAFIHLNFRVYNDFLMSNSLALIVAQINRMDGETRMNTIQYSRQDNHSHDRYKYKYSTPGDSISLLCLTKKEVWQHSANPQLQGGVKDVSQHFLAVSRVFNHSNGGTLPGLNDATTTQRCHTCALLP